MPPAETGATLAAMPAKGLALRLRPAAEVNFIAAPRRPSRSEVPRGGIVTFEVAHAGGYLVTISGDGWLDLVLGRLHADGRFANGKQGMRGPWSAA